MMFTRVALRVYGLNHKFLAWLREFPLARRVVETLGGPNF